MTERSRLDEGASLHVPPHAGARPRPRDGGGGLRRRRRRRRREGAATTGGEAAAGVSGDISILALWTSGEQASFEAVLDGFKEENPDVNISYKSAEDVAPVLSTAIQGGNPPDIAAVPNPGLMRQFVESGDLKDIEFARATVEENFSESWVDLASVDNKLYGVFFKGANKSTVWYNVHAYEDAGIEPAEGLGRVPPERRDAEAVRRAGMVDRRRGRLDAHRLVRERLPPARGRGEVRPAHDARDPVDRPVGQGHADRAAEGLRRHRQHRRRDERRAPGGLPDVGDQRVREPDPAEGRDGLRGRLRRRA